jgi:hypothetical protein
MIDTATLQQWLNSYVEAWRSNDPEQIGSLFSEDARYAWSPFDEEPAHGRDAIVEAWLNEPDDPDTWECSYEPLAITGDLGVARGWTRYRRVGSKPAREYANVFVMRFDSANLCSEFTEWYMERPTTG